jgi:aspartate-semialdehyde dehydrogenase
VTRVAVVHSGSLVGRELRQQIAARAERFEEIRVLSTVEEEIGDVTEVAGAAAFVGRVDEHAFDGIDLAYFCGSIERDREALAALPPAVAAVLLSRGATAEDAPAAVAGVGLAGRGGARRLTSPHPATVAATLLLDRLGPFAPRRAVATVALPVTVDSDSGLDDLFDESRRLMSFQSPAGRGRQIAFNLTPDATAAAQVEREIAAALGRPLEVAVQIVRAGVFHGLALSLWVELEPTTDAGALRRALGGGGVEVARKPAGVGPVSVAGSERLVVGEVRPGAGGYSIWAAMDNLVRGGALNALELGDELLEPPAG